MNVGGDTYSTAMGFGELQPIFLSGSGVSFHVKSRRRKCKFSASIPVHTCKYTLGHFSTCHDYVVCIYHFVHSLCASPKYNFFTCSRNSITLNRVPLHTSSFTTGDSGYMLHCMCTM